jgi:hypothetical protein
MTHKILAVVGSSLMVAGICDLAMGFTPLSDKQLRRVAAGKTWGSKFCQDMPSSYSAKDCNCYNQQVDPPGEDYWMCGTAAVSNQECWGPALTNCTPQGNVECNGYYIPTEPDCTPLGIPGVEECEGISKRCLTTK